MEGDPAFWKQNKIGTPKGKTWLVPIKSLIISTGWAPDVHVKPNLTSELGGGEDKQFQFYLHI